MFFFVNTHAQTPSYIKNYPFNIYKASPVVSNLVKDDNGLIYFGTNKGLVIYDGVRWETVIVSNYSDVKCLELGPDGKVYVGANSNFGYILNDPIKGFQYISLSDSLPPYETNFNDVWQIVFLNDDIYFQTYAGIYKWNKNEIIFDRAPEIYIFNINGKLYGSSFLTGEFGLYDHGNILPVKDSPKLKKDLVFQIFKYDNNNYLLATSESGLFLFNESTKKIKIFKASINEFLTKFRFYDGIQISPNLYALGSWDGGIAFMDSIGNQLNYFDKQNGLSANLIYDLMMGENNDLWLATSNGISRISLDSLGYESQKPVVPKASILRNIHISLGDEIIEVSMPGTADLGKADYYKLNNNSLDLYQLPSSLLFYYSAPCFSGEETSFSVFLEGYDRKWSDFKPEAVKEYTNLKGGNYTFYVQAKNDTNGQVSEIVSMQINVFTPWYHSTWLQILIGFIILFCVFIIIRLMLLRLKTQNARLENIVNERTQDLMDQQKKLSELNKNLSTSNKELDNFVYHTSHDLRAPLKSVLGLVDLAKREDAEGRFSPYHDRMESSILKLEEFISSIIQYSSNSKADVHIKKIDFSEIVSNSINELQFHEAFDLIDIKLDITMKDAFYSDEKRIQIILNNLLSNAVKYYDKLKANPEIHIKIEQKNSDVEVSITDNGIGIKSEFLDKVFFMFFRASENSYGSGLGLYIIKETVKKLNGSITINSEEGEYTSFTFLLPNLKQKVKA